VRALQQVRPRSVALPHLSACTLAEQYVHLYRKLLNPQPFNSRNGIGPKGRAA
jgi:hypothetical protein